MHYAVRKGLAPERMTWLTKCVKRQLANGGFESWGSGPSWYYEWEGWGTLTKMRTKWQRGDPGTWKDGLRVSRAHQVPCAIRAVDYDFSPLNGGNGRQTARCPGTVAKRSDYRSDAVVPIGSKDGTHYLDALRKGEWCDYTLSVAEAGKYKIVVCCSNIGPLQLSARVDGGIPVSARFAESASVQDVVIGKLDIPAGSPVLRIEVGAASAAKLYAIRIER